MGIARRQKVDEDLHIALPNNPFVPPKGDVCFIKKLPPELLSRVFEAGTAGDDDSEDEDDLTADVWDTGEGEGNEETDGAAVSSGPSFPVVASLVCRRWRDVAFTTPSLWTTIVVTPVALPPYPLETTLLERSKNLPVDIYVKYKLDRYEDIKEPSDANLRFLFSMLILHIHRWRTIEVSVSEYHHMYEFLNAVSNPSILAAPQLTTLRLQCHRDDGTEDFDSFEHPSMSKHLTLFGGSAPSLTSIFLWGVHIDWNQPWIASASNLTDLYLTLHSQDVRPSWAQFSTILRGASALKRFSLCQSGPSGDPAEWFIEPTPGSPADLNAPIQLPRVTDFVLVLNSQARAIGLLRKFYLPSLKNLILNFQGGDYTDFVHELARPAAAQEQPRSLLNRLESLTIEGLPCLIDCVETLYAELQNLTSLNISLMFLPTRFLDILGTPCTLDGRGGIWLSRLQTLGAYGTSGDALRDVVQRRKDAGVPLSSLQVEKGCDMDEEDLAWLKENVETIKFFDGF